MHIVEEEQKKTGTRNASAVKQTVELGKLDNSHAISGPAILNKEPIGPLKQQHVNILDIFKIKGKQKNLQTRG